MTEEKKFFNENGYVVIRDAFTEKEVEDYREIVADYFNNYTYTTVLCINNGIDFFVSDK